MVADNTRERILDSAERLFAERGFDGTSIRDVTADASANLAAVHYHFGSKEDLVREVLRRVVTPANAARIRMMDAADQCPGGPFVGDLLRAFIQPELELARDLGPRGPGVIRLVGRMFSEPNEVVQSICMDLFGEVGGRFIMGLQRALPAVPQEEVVFRMQCVVGVLTFFMADTTPGPWKLIDLNDPQRATGRLIAFLEPAMSAPFSTVFTQVAPNAGSQQTEMSSGHSL